MFGICVSLYSVICVFLLSYSYSQISVIPATYRDGILFLGLDLKADIFYQAANTTLVCADFQLFQFF